MALTFGTPTREVVGRQRSITSSVTFDSSYPTGGEAVTAANFGLSVIDDVIVHGPAMNTDVTRAVPVSFKSSTSKLVAYGYDGDDTGAVAGLKEIPNTTDLSTYTVRITVLGC
jgi:hypothetical protein